MFRKCMANPGIPGKQYVDFGMYGVGAVCPIGVRVSRNTSRPCYCKFAAVPPYWYIEVSSRFIGVERP